MRTKPMLKLPNHIKEKCIRALIPKQKVHKVLQKHKLDDFAAKESKTVSMKVSRPNTAHV